MSARMLRSILDLFSKTDVMYILEIEFVYRVLEVFLVP